jgi:phosphotransferase system  glucose/maltose/N-acetylglucosamine-specific IIC component
MVSNPFSDPNWSTAVVDFIDRWLGFVRDHTTRPLIAVIRGLVFGTMALVGVMFCVVILLIGVMRALVSLGDVWLSHDTAVWVAYFVLGLIFRVAVVLPLDLISRLFAARLNSGFRSHVTFRSNKFPPYEEEEKQINPGLCGKRLAEYYAKTAPILPYYKARGTLRGVDGMADIDHVTAALSAILGPRPAGGSR